MGCRADRACSTFPSDRAEGIKTVSNRVKAVRGSRPVGLTWALPPMGITDGEQALSSFPQLSQ